VPILNSIHFIDIPGGIQLRTVFDGQEFVEQASLSPEDRDLFNGHRDLLDVLVLSNMLLALMTDIRLWIEKKYSIDEQPTSQ
jgi:hypothetical protein